jgi:exopolyphosphatase/guanosine-5'-triphosphate,3'-diphosphate pyrophosphatase
MAKRTAVIDIGSNSARLVIFQKTSRYGFHLLCQHKSRVRIGEGAYQRQGNLQPEPMERAFLTLESFARILDEYHVKKTLCVATSALRDAPNRSEFIHRVRNKLGIDIRVIDGPTEARYGAIAANNLLPIDDAVTIDIGGGSADMARIESGKIIETYSLDLGTVRLKELFTHKHIDLAKALDFVKIELARLPKSFQGQMAVGIGGTARSLAKAIMQADDYPLDKLHAFTCSVADHRDFFDRIIESKISDLEGFAFKPERFDTIREGTLILREILRVIGARELMISGVGVREGVYLHDRLRKDHDRFPKSINPSIQSIRDRFDLLGFPEGNKHRIARKLFDLFSRRFKADKEDLEALMRALDLSNIGKMLTIYKEHQHAYYIAMQELNFGFTHREMILIALILRSKGSRRFHKALYREYKTLLPGKKKLKWLVFIYTLTLILYENSTQSDIVFSCKNGKVLSLPKVSLTYLAQEQIKALALPEKITIMIKE